MDLDFVKILRVEGNRRSLLSNEKTKTFLSHIIKVSDGASSSETSFSSYSHAHGFSLFLLF